LEKGITMEKFDKKRYLNLPHFLKRRRFEKERVAKL